MRTRSAYVYSKTQRDTAINVYESYFGRPHGSAVPTGVGIVVSLAIAMSVPRLVSTDAPVVRGATLQRDATTANAHGYAIELHTRIGFKNACGSV
jgi:hypothetical protein